MSAVVQRARVLLHFFSFQGITLAGNFLFGLLCIRFLPPSEYVKFVVIFSVCGTLVVLMDASLSTSVIPLVGERVDDRKLIADYVASLRQLSHYLYAVVAMGTLVLFPYLVKNRGWNWHIVVAMVAILLLSTWFIRIQAAYGTVLLLLRERTLWYRGQLIQSLGTLLLLGIFFAVHRLNGFIAILINVSGILFIGSFYFFQARNRLGEQGQGSREKRRAIVHLALPNMPQSIFFALQGQLSVFLITFFGHTVGVASVGALARLAGIFILFSQMNGMLVEPYFAKLPKTRLVKNYLIAISLAVAGCSAITLLAWLAPGLFLWVLGPQYSKLSYEVLLVIASGAISTLSGVMWCIHSARRFVYWWNVSFNISLTVVAQVLCILHFDMGTVRGVLMLNLFTSLVSLVVTISSGVYGLRYGPRDSEKAVLAAPESAFEAQRVLEAETGMETNSALTEPGTSHLMPHLSKSAVGGKP